MTEKNKTYNMYVVCEMFEKGSTIPEIAKEFNKTEREIKVLVHYGLR